MSESLESHESQESREYQESLVIEAPASCKVVVDGMEIRQRISSVRLEQYVDRHHVLKVRANQEGEGTSGGSLTDPSVYSEFLGKSIAITILPEGGTVSTSRKLEFIGTVTEVSFENSIDGLNRVVITAHSPTISLDGAPRISAYEEKSASDIIKAVAGNYPISVTVESTSSVMVFTMQHRETDYKFIKRLAEQNGLFTFWDGHGLKVTKASGSGPITLTWLETLGRFSMGLGTASSKIASKSWYYKDKREIEGDSDTGSLRSSPSDLTKLSISASDTVFSEAGSMMVPKAADQSELDGSLGHRVAGQVGRMVRCKGESNVPEVTVGRCVQVNGMDQFDGLYWILEVCHIFDERGGYHNKFVSTPLEVAFPPQNTHRLPVTDLQAGVVINIEDPEALGRIKVNMPALGIESPWIRYVTPHAGPERGWVSVPEVEDEVVVGFENSNPDLPIAIGSVYNGMDKPPVATDGKNEEKIFITAAGNEIRLTDKDGSEQIKICTASGNHITLDADAKSISICDEGGNKVVLDGNSSSISIESTGDISIKGANITLDAQQGIEIKSTTDTKIEAMGSLKAKGMAGVDLEALAICNIKGALINLN